VHRLLDRRGTRSTRGRKIPRRPWAGGLGHPARGRRRHAPAGADIVIILDDVAVVLPDTRRDDDTDAASGLVLAAAADRGALQPDDPDGPRVAIRLLGSRRAGV